MSLHLLFRMPTDKGRGLMRFVEPEQVSQAGYFELVAPGNDKLPNLRLYFAFENRMLNPDLRDSSRRTYIHEEALSFFNSYLALNPFPTYRLKSIVLPIDSSIADASKASFTYTLFTED